MPREAALKSKAQIKSIGISYSSSDSSINDDSSSEDASDHEAYVRDKVAHAALRIKQRIVEEDPARFFNKGSISKLRVKSEGQKTKRRKILSAVVKRPTIVRESSQISVHEPIHQDTEMRAQSDFIFIEEPSGSSDDESDEQDDVRNGKWFKIKWTMNKLVRTLLRRRHKLSIESLTHMSMWIFPAVPLPTLQYHHPRHDLTYLRKEKVTPHHPRTLQESIAIHCFRREEPCQPDTTSDQSSRSSMPFRLGLFTALDSRVYELIMLMVVIASCVFVSGSSGSNTGIGATTYRIMDIIFAVIFSLEFIAKNICLGVVLHRGSYFRSLWNTIDAMLLVVLLIGLGFSNTYGRDLSVLRPLRAVRPLRALNVLGGIGIITRALSRSAGGLLSVSLLVGGTLLIASIVTVQVWSGALHQRCFDPTTQHVYLHMYCAYSGNLQVDPPAVVIDDQFAVTNTGTGGRCPDGLACGKVAANPLVGYASDDHLGVAILQVLRVVTLESWSDMLFRLYEISGPAVIIYFFILVLIGAFFIPNLILAIFNEQFGHSLRVHNRREKAKAVVRELKKEARVIEVVHTLHSASMPHDRITLPRFSSTQVIEEAIAMDAQRTRSKIISRLNNSIATTEDTQSMVWGIRWLRVRNLCHILSEGYPLYEYNKHERQRKVSEALGMAKRSSVVSTGLCRTTLPTPLSLPADHELDKPSYNAFHSKTHIMGPMAVVMMTVLLTNLVFLALHHYDEPESITQLSRISNYVFVGLFSVEVLVRLAGLGFTGYVSDTLMLMDTLILLICFIEFFIIGSRSLSALRAIRLVRLVPFFRMFPYVRNVLLVLERSAHLFAYALLFSLLMTLLAATVGVALFDEQLYEVNDPLPTISATLTNDSDGQTVLRNRVPLMEFWRLRESQGSSISNYTINFSQNYDPVDGVEADVFRVSGGFSSLQEALLTVFEILAVDGWNNLMYAAMEATSGDPAVAAIYFVVVAVFLSGVITAMFLSLMIVAFIATSVESLAEKNRDRGKPKLTWRGIVLVHRQEDPVDHAADAGTSSERDISLPRIKSNFRLDVLVVSSDDDDEEEGPKVPTHKAGNDCPACLAPYLPPLPPPPLSIPLTAAKLHRKRRHCQSLAANVAARAACDRLAALVANALRRLRLQDLEAQTSQYYSFGGSRRSDASSIFIESSFPVFDTPIIREVDGDFPTTRLSSSYISWPKGMMGYRSNILSEATWNVFDKVAKNLSVLQQNGTEAENLQSSKNTIEKSLTSSFQAMFVKEGEDVKLPTRSEVNRLFMVLQAPCPSEREDDNLEQTERFRDKEALECLQQYLSDCSVLIDTLALGREMVGGACQDTCRDLYAAHHVAHDPAHVDGAHNDVSDQDEHHDSHDHHHDAFSYFPSNTPTARVLALHVVGSHAFHRFILLCIFLSCAILVLNSPRFTYSSPVKTFLLVLDTCLLSVFVVDIILKMIAFGVWNSSKESFFRSGWNIVDLVVVVISFAALGIPKSYGASSASNTLKAMKAAKALLPLEFIVHLPGLQVVSQSLIGAAGSMLGVAVIAAVNFLVFGIIGVNMFMGSFHHCSDPTIRDQSQCYGTFQFTTATHPNETFTIQRTWVIPVRNFDHLGSAILTLFELGTGSGMGPAMFEAITDSPYYNPKAIGAPEFFKALYFIVFFVVTRYIISNLFVAVVVFHLNTVRYRTGTAFLTAAQTSWVESKRLLYHFQPIAHVTKPSWPAVSISGNLQQRYFCLFGDPKMCNLIAFTFLKLRVFCFHVMQSSITELVMFALIVANTVIYGMEHYRMSDDLDNALNIANHVFSLIFLIELLMRLMAAGFVRCLKSAWFKLDLLIVVLSVVDFTLFMLDTRVALGPSIFRAFRLLRILRLLRLLRNRTSLELLAEAALFSLPPLFNVFLLLVVILFIYAIAGVQLFAYVINNGALNDYYNFHHMGNALQLLFVMATGELWTDIMHACMVRPPNCANTNCGIDTAPVYFITFMIVTRFVLINVFVEVVLETYAAATRMTKRGRTASKNEAEAVAKSNFKDKDNHGDAHHRKLFHPHHRHPRIQRRFLGDLEVMRTEWQAIDRAGDMRIPIGQLPLLLSRLPLPMGFTNSTSLMTLREHREKGRISAQMLKDLSNESPFIRFLHHLRTHLPLVNFGGFVHYHDLLVKEGRQIFDDLAIAKHMEHRATKRIIAEIPDVYRNRFEGSLLTATEKEFSSQTSAAKLSQESNFGPTFEPILDQLAKRSDLVRNNDGCPTTAEKWFAARAISAAVRGWLVRKQKM